MPVVIEPKRNRLAVLGSPIGHSRSPVIHHAAYATLGLDWSYDAVELAGEGLRGFLDSVGTRWRGVSLTMPLKRDILTLLEWRDPVVELVGAANTVSFVGGRLSGFNTDVYGVEQSLRGAGIDSLSTVQVLGAGATALSVLAAVARLGATRVVVAARTPSRAGALTALGATLGVETVVRAWAENQVSFEALDAVVNTVPGGAFVSMQFSESVRRSAILFDVVYEPWPTALAASWAAVDGTVISGRELLINQAVGQVRVFVSGDPNTPLDNESAVIAAMRAAFV